MKTIYGEPVTQEEQENSIGYFSAADGVVSDIDGLRLQAMALLSQTSKAGAGWIGSVGQLVEILGVDDAFDLDYAEMKVRGKKCISSLSKCGDQQQKRRERACSGLFEGTARERKCRVH